MNTGAPDFSEHFRTQREHFLQQLKHSGVAERIAKLRKLRAWILAHEKDILDAVHADFRKPVMPTLVTEIKPVTAELDHAIAQLHRWMRPRHAPPPLFLIGTRSHVAYEPKGTALIMSPWNFPFMLAVGPLVSAIAAGCNATIKPSEFTPATSAVLERMAAEVFDPKEVHVITGGVETAQALLHLPWNHIFFTGSTQVGRIVMRAAAEHLSSVTLELGGCNPAIVDETANLKDAASRIAWGKWFNNGQSCLAPNHVFVHDAVHDEFVEALRKMIAKQYGKDADEIKKSPDLARLVNAQHFHRVRFLLDGALEAGAVTATGGEADEQEKYIAPVVLTNVSHDAAILKEEIFGPVLPIVRYKDIREVLDRQRKQPSPLALYVFTGRRKRAVAIVKSTSSGTAVINDTTVQFPHAELPFGGQNESGIGKSHGHAGFLEFSHERSVLHQRKWITTLSIMYPPYNRVQEWLIRKIIRWF